MNDQIAPVVSNVEQATAGDDGQASLYSGMSWSQSNHGPAHPEFCELRFLTIKIYFIIESAFAGGETLPYVADEVVLVKITIHNHEHRRGKVVPILGHDAPTQPLHPVARVLIFGLIPFASRCNADANAYGLLGMFGQSLIDLTQQR
jgi:hypothetical protein